jgi:hypothetical protein
MVSGVTGAQLAHTQPDAQVRPDPGVPWFAHKLEKGDDMNENDTAQTKRSNSRTGADRTEPDWV